MQLTDTHAALAAVLLHVVNYNATAHLEFNTRVFTRVLGAHAVYFYAAYLVASALLRDHFMQLAVDKDAGTLVLMSQEIATAVGTALFVVGVALNLWTLKALGIKGMYNGDSFGHLFESPVTDGPFRYLSDPQYFGTSLAALGYAVRAQSLVGYVLAAWMYFVFTLSAKLVEEPHMRRIYAGAAKKKKRTSKRAQ